MPIFDYRCDTCEHTEELMVPANVESISCPMCAQGMMQKQLGATKSKGGGTPKFHNKKSTRN